MSDIVTLNGYNIKDEKAVRSYETVALMKADTKLKEGYHVKTKGYYQANDGGHGEYIIVDDDTLVDDGGSIHVLTNGLRAKLIIGNEIDPKVFGVYGDNIHDDTETLQNAINFCIENNLLFKSSKSNTYKITDTLIIGDIIQANFNDSKIIANFDDDILKITVSDDSDYIEDRENDYMFGGFLENLIIEGNNEGTGINFEYQKKMKITNVEIRNCNIGLYTQSATECLFEDIRFNSCNIGLKVNSDDTVFNNIFGRFCNIGMQLLKFTRVIDSHFWVRPDESEFNNSVYAEVYGGAVLKNVQIDSYQTGVKTLGTGGYTLDISGQWQQPMDSLETYYLFKFTEASNVKNGFSVRLHDFNAITKNAEPYCIFSDIEANQFRGFIDYSTCRCFRISKFPLTTHLELGNISEKLDTPLINRVNVENNMIHIQFFAKVLESFTYLEFAKLPTDGYIETKPLIGIPYQAITTNQYAVNNPVTQFVAGFCSRTKTLTLLCLDNNNPVSADSYIYIDFTYINENIQNLTE